MKEKVIGKGRDLGTKKRYVIVNTLADFDSCYYLLKATNSPDVALGYLKSLNKSNPYNYFKLYDLVTNEELIYSDGELLCV